MAEKIKHQKSKSEIRENLYDLKLHYYTVDDTNGNESKFITGAYGKQTEILKSKQLPFFYHEYLYKFSELNAGYGDIKDYFRTIRQEVKVALDIPYVLESLEDFIEVLDRPADNNAKKLLIRYKKLKRLESVYDLLVSFTLSLLHNFFWKDITLGVDKGSGTKNLRYRIQQVLPIVMKLKESLEDEIEKEFPSDRLEQEMFLKIRGK